MDRFLDHLRSLTNQEALHTSGVLSKKVLAQRGVVKLILRSCLAPKRIRIGYYGDRLGCKNRRAA